MVCRSYLDVRIRFKCNIHDSQKMELVSSFLVLPHYLGNRTKRNLIIYVSIFCKHFMIVSVVPLRFKYLITIVLLVLQDGEYFCFWLKKNLYVVYSVVRSASQVCSPVWFIVLQELYRAILRCYHLLLVICGTTIPLFCIFRSTTSHNPAL